MAESQKNLPQEIDDLYNTPGGPGEGIVHISENVFASIIKKYTLDIPEVIKFVSSSFVGSLVEMVSKKSADSIHVNLDNENVEVTVNVVLKFGSHIPTVARKIQQVISQKIEEYTGNEVAKVNVNIVDLLHNAEEELSTEEPAEG